MVVVYVLAQAVEQWLSVRAGQVQILGTNFGFFGSDCRSILAGHWALSVNEVIDQTMSYTSILLSVSYPVCEPINFTNAPMKKNPKGRERPIFKKKFN